MQKITDFNHNKRTDMLNLGCTLPNIAKLRLHKSTTVKFHFFTENDKDFLEKLHENMVGGASFVFTRKAIVDEIFIGAATCPGAKTLLEMTLVSFSVILCVKQCQLVCTHDGARFGSWQNYTASKQDKEF